jgi:hypothetical protein
VVGSDESGGAYANTEGLHCEVTENCGMSRFLFSPTSTVGVSGSPTKYASGYQYLPDATRTNSERTPTVGHGLDGCKNHGLARARGWFALKGREARARRLFPKRNWLVLVFFCPETLLQLLGPRHRRYTAP